MIFRRGFMLSADRFKMSLTSYRNGEVMAKRPLVTKGYYRDAEKTAELFDEDGFLHTGDIGQLLPDGRLNIIDRKKHIFKLAQGEYVAPEKIESVYVQCPLVDQFYVDGDILEPNLVDCPEMYKSALLKDSKEHTTNSYFPDVRTLFDAFQRGLKVIGCIRHSMVIVPLYDTLGADAATFILGHTGAEVVVVDDLAKLDNVLRECPSTLKHVVVIGNALDTKEAEQAQEKAKTVGVQLHTFEQLVTEGGQTAVDDHPPKPSDTYIVCYTSGTTGTPKGVLLTHTNVLSNLAALTLLLERFMPELIDPQGSIISYLPLSHMFEQLKLLKPTLFKEKNRMESLYKKLEQKFETIAGQQNSNNWNVRFYFFGLFTFFVVAISYLYNEMHNMEKRMIREVHEVDLKVHEVDKKLSILIARMEAKGII